MSLSEPAVIDVVAVAGSTDDGVVAVAGLDNVIAVAGLDRVVAITGLDDVVAAAGFDVAWRAAGQDDHQVLAGFALVDFGLRRRYHGQDDVARFGGLRRGVVDAGEAVAADQQEPSPGVFDELDADERVVASDAGR